MISKIFLLCQVSIKQKSELEIIKIDPPILEILFSRDLCPDFANYGYLLQVN